ncbi:hypothetical protein KL86DYS1_30186 [uncultured Dysgonomonas sp.]|uniref:Uncharacterized protein n=1 Tax=uncultured Dysgonomonas sp. TaxID=206096 RepID=A0A212JRP8_9BACT|nr:hypothetical protein KL86DYS1_30186 [uncultured Dysgonomonas sp.]
MDEINKCNVFLNDIDFYKSYFTYIFNYKIIIFINMSFYIDFFLEKLYHISCFEAFF